MLEYLFNKRQGDIFDGLKRHLAHHSVAMLIVELFQIQIKPEDNNIGRSLRNMDWDTSDKSDDESNKDEGQLTACQI
jgi:hypothetical protein